MKPIISGSSKDFYPTENPNVYKVVFKDLVHGRGAQKRIAGTGRLREEFCYWFYRFLEKQGIATHLIPGDALLDKGILVYRTDMIPLELIARYVARGNWVDAHKFPLLPAGVVFDEPLVEFCLKWKAKTKYLPYEDLSQFNKKLHKLLKPQLEDILLPEFDVKDDPRVNDDMIIALNRYALSDKLRGHLPDTKEELHALYRMTLEVNNYLAEFLRSQGWILEDGKFEAGRLPNDTSGRFIIADEYTQDSSRVRDKAGNSLTKDLFRQSKSNAEIYDGYAKLTEAMKNYAK